MAEKPSMGKNIARLRKEQGLTQSDLADKLSVSYQAISQWERGETIPDVMCLPDIAAVFDVSVDELFGLEPDAQRIKKIPDDDTIRAVILIGNKVVRHIEIDAQEFNTVEFIYHGEAANIESDFAIQCGNVKGSVEAGTYVICGDVGGYVDAGSHVMCGDINGYVDASTYVSCANIGGYVDAGENVNCVNVGGDVKSSGHVKCAKVEGNISADTVLNYK